MFMMGQQQENLDDNQQRAGGGGGEGGVCNYGNQEEGVYPREDKQETQLLSGTCNTSE